MILDIKPFKESIFEALEEEIISVALWWERGYKLMYADSWKFGFKPPVENTPDIIGTRLDDGNGGRMGKILEEYHGISAIRHDDKTPEELVEMVKQELREKRPVLLGMDPFWCHWNPAYQKVHMKYHFPLGVGFDEEGKGIYCNDSKFNQEKVLIPMDEFLKSCGQIITFKLVGKERKDFDWKNNIYNSVEKLFNGEYKKSSFEMVKEFADTVEERLNISDEVKGHDVIIMVPLFLKLQAIGTYRRQFADLLIHLAEVGNAPELKELAPDMDQLGNDWLSVRSMLMKAVYKKKTDELIKKVAAKIRNIADREEKFAHTLLKVCS